MCSLSAPILCDHLPLSADRTCDSLLTNGIQQRGWDVILFCQLPGSRDSPCWLDGVRGHVEKTHVARDFRQPLADSQGSQSFAARN